MKRTLMFIALIAVCLPAAAQPGSAAKPCLHLKKVVTDAAAVAQGGSLQVALQLETKHCALLYQGEDTRFELQGLTIPDQQAFLVYAGSTRYLKIEPPQATNAPNTARRLVYELRVDAPRKAPLGKQDLLATVSYQAEDDEGLQSPQQLRLSIPINVVPAGTNVPPPSENRAKQVGTSVLLAVAMVPLLPLMLLGSIVYFFQYGQWPTC
jgi:hypothetical protein